MKRIIVPIDFSKESLHGLQLAIQLANVANSLVEMVYVQKKSVDYSSGNLEDEHKYAEHRFKEVKKTFESSLLQPEQLTYIIKKGKIYQEVVNQAEAFDDSLIVSSTHGASGFEDLFIGSNTYKIVSATERPVITIRTETIPKQFETIILPIDTTPDTRQKVPYTARLAKMFNATVHIANVFTSDDDLIYKRLRSYSNQVVDYLEKYSINYKLASLKGKNITDTILQYSESVHGDLISIMTEQSVDINNFVLGNFAQQMLSKSNVPVLCITPKELFKSGGFRTQG